MRKRLVFSAAIALALAAGWGLHAGAGRADQAVASLSASAPAVAVVPAATAAPRLPAAAASGSSPVDRATMSKVQTSGERFPDTEVGRALDQHLVTLVAVDADADARKDRSLAELRKHAREASADLLAAYHQAKVDDEFGRWLISQTLAELRSDDGYAALKEIASSPWPPDAGDSDQDGNAAANESAIRQAATGGLAALAHAGNAAAEAELLAIALDPPSGNAAVRTMAIKGYLAAGDDYAARVQALQAQLPAQYRDVITLTVTRPEDPPPPVTVPTRSKHGG